MPEQRTYRSGFLYSELHNSFDKNDTLAVVRAELQQDLQQALADLEEWITVFGAECTVGHLLTQLPPHP